MHPVFSRIERGSVPGVDEWIEELGAELEVLARLEGISQEPEWHAEGSVKVHTDMVLQEIEAMLRPGGAAGHLEGWKRQALALSGLLHDVGKVFNTRQRFTGDRIRIVSPQHPARGRTWWALHHHALGLPREMVETVMALIGHHHDPHRLVSEDAPASAYRRLARLSDLELVYFLELADLRGRKAVDREQKLELLEMFRLQAVDYGLWGNPDPWADWREHIEQTLGAESPAVRRLAWAEGVRAAEEGRIFTPHEAVSRSHVWRERDRDPCELVVLCGLSGSGKSTFAAEQLPGHAVVSLDRWRERLAKSRRDHGREGEVLQAARGELRALLRQGRDVVWDATALRKDHRGPVVQLGFDYHAWVEIVCLSTPLEEIEKRHRTRRGAVPPVVRQRQIDRCEWPFASHAHAMRMVKGMR